MWRYFYLVVFLQIALGLTALGQAQLPVGYSVSRQFGKPCRIAVENLPWLVYSSEPRLASVVEHALATWNSEGLRLGLGPLFQSTSSPDQAQLTIDWSGAGLPRDKAGGVYWEVNMGYKRVLKLVMDGTHRIPDGNRAEILLQELGHVLGLSDSVDRADIMYTVMRTRRLGRPAQARLSARDREAFAWLYGQTEFVPVLAPGQRWERPKPIADPEPSFTPVP
jgi:hypothetical protein